MDGTNRARYEAIVTDTAERLILRIDCLVESAVATQLNAELSRLGEVDLVNDRSTCNLIVQTSDDATAQSFRNVRDLKMTIERWASMALANDTRRMIRSRLLAGVTPEHAELRSRVANWQREILRADFSDETPWAIAADWHEEHGDEVKAELCRKQASVDST